MPTRFCKERGDGVARSVRFSPGERPEVTWLPVHRFDRQLLGRVRDCTGRFGPVYRRAAVLPSARGDPLVVFLRSKAALVPCGMAVPWEVVRPRPGLLVIKKDRSIQVGSGSRVVLRLVGDGQSLRADAPGAECKADLLKEKLSRLRLPQRTRTLLGRGQCESRQESRVVAAAAPGLGRLVDRLRKGVAGSGAYRDPVGGLAGLGPGSSPTGDDLLVGVAALAWRLAAAGRLAQESLAGFCTALFELPPDSTTRTGREMLAQAARGVFFQTLLEFVEALVETETDGGRLAEAAGRLGRTGGRSGCDMLAGVIVLAGAFAQGARV